MQDVYTLTTLDELKALADPLRLQLLDLFGKEPLTTKQAATRLGEPSNKLYHHVLLLEQLGLIELVKTKPNRGTTEKYYSAVARHFHVDDALLHSQPVTERTETMEGLLDGVLQTLRSQFRGSMAAGFLGPENPERAGTIAQTTVRASASEIRKLEKQVNRWLDKVRAVDHPEGEQVYGVTVAFFPLVGEEKAKRGSV